MEEYTPSTALRTIEHFWIEMPDGVRLSARLWLPAGGPHPALLEYIPYRKRDLVRARDARNHPFFAAHGYACLRVDMRGSGDSEGVMRDMYDDHELSDARYVIEWIASQPWCTGRVGMFGTSWGGTASLQAAVDAPGPLKAVLANCATIDRFEDDIHWMGGCLLTDSIEWGAMLPAILAAPPDSSTVGEGWFDIWQTRLEGMTFPFESWLRHNTRGDYWRHGSVRYATDRLSCPILTIGGWADRYSHSVMPLVQARPDIVRGIVGPWGHHYPDHGEPGPAIGFQQVALEWWDHWLQRDETGMPGGPALRLWQRAFDPPQDRLTLRSGRWIGLGDPAEAAPAEWYLNSGRLSDAPAATGTFEVPLDPRHGECAGDTGYHGRPGGMPLDQSLDDVRSLCFDSDPLGEPVDLLGAATLTVQISAETLPAQLVCRLCDVAPDGGSNLVTRTVLALELDETLDAPRSEGTSKYRIIFPTTAYRFARGHCIRLALAASYWPLVWPSLPPTTFQLPTQGAVLTLPPVPKEVEELTNPFPDAQDLPTEKDCVSRSSGPLHRNPLVETGGQLRSAWRQPGLSVQHTDIDVEIETETVADHSLDPDSIGRADSVFAVRIRVARTDGIAEIRSQLRLSGDHGALTAQSDMSVSWQGAVIFKRDSVVTV